MILGMLVAISLVLTFFNLGRHSIMLSIACAASWLGSLVLMLLGSYPGLSISSIWGQVVGFVFVLMIFVPLVQYISKVGKTEISINKDGKSYKMWDKVPRTRPETDSDRQMDYRQSFRKRVDNAIVARQRRPRSRRNSR